MSDSSPSSSEVGKDSSSTSGSKAEGKKPAAKASHPSTAEMVMNAIGTLKERKGSSLLAIKKFMATEYNLDTEKHGTYIKKFLKKAVESGDIVQTSGTGATGSFRLPKKGDVKPNAKTPEPDEEVSKKVVKKSAVDVKPEAAKKTTAKQPANAKKTAKAVEPEQKTKTSVKKTVKSDQPKAASKMKKTTKSPTKPKAPRVKKTTSPSKAKAVKK